MIPYDLPPQPTPFVGRAHELIEIFRCLRTPECRLLTLVGPGGIGKTRLALQAAQSILDFGFVILDSAAAPADNPKSKIQNPKFEDGVFFVPLQPVSTTSGIIASIAEATGFHFYSDTPPRQQLVNFLREKRMLLVLDNMEHLPEGTSVVAELLTKAPGVKLLVTSQKALRVREEWFHPLTGMTLPPSDDPHAHPVSARNGEAGRAESDAVQLFGQSARRARADFDLDAEREQVVRICRLVDGIPLALELAAAWLKVLTCQQIADEIERGLDILTASQQNVPTRHQSMTVVLEQSWQLLHPEEQDMLKRLSVFRGGFTQEAAAAVAHASLPLLGTLVAKVLIWVTPGRRYQMHELLRQFAQRQLAMTPAEEMATRTRHSDYYLRFLSTRAPLLISKARRIALDEIGQEIENVRLGWNWAAQQGDLAALDQAVEPLYHFYQIQSRYQEGREIFAQAWEHLQPSSRSGQAARRAIVPVRILARCGAFCHFLCEYDLAGKFLHECLTQAQLLDQRAEVAFTLNFLGQLAMWQGDKALARQHLFQSLAISQENGDQSGAASALEKLANLVHATFGEYAECKELAAQSLALSRGLGRPDWVAYALDTLGYATFCLGEYDDAEAYYRESLELFEAIGDQYGKAMAQGGIALVLWAMWGGKYVEATAYFQKSLLICRTIGHQGQVAGRLAGMARIANDLGDYAQAQQLAHEGLTIARELGSPVYLSHILYCLGESAYGLGDLQAARTYLIEALVVTSKTGLLAYLVIALFHYATLLVKESEQEPNGSIQKQAKALDLLALVQSHPAGWQVYKTRAARRYAELETQLPAAIVLAAKTRNESRTLEAAVAEILLYLKADAVSIS